MRFGRMPQGIVVVAIVLSAIMLSLPSVQAVKSPAETLTINGVTVTVTKKDVKEGVNYVGQVVTGSYVETFDITSTSIKGVNETVTSINTIGDGFQITEVGDKIESATRTDIYVSMTYTNQTGSYSVEVTETEVDGVILGYMTEDLFAPIGKYTIALTPLGSGNYEGIVTLPTGEIIDPGLYQYVDAWHGPWWASYNLKGWILWWYSWEMVTAGLLALIINIISIFLAPVIPVALVLDLLLGAASMYPATVEPVHRTYWDVLFLYGAIPFFAEAGFYTNQYWTPWGWQHPGWTYIPLWSMGSLSWHTGVWPVGF